MPDALAEKLRSGGAVVFSSAAALTLGVATVPVYEIYKVGLDPYWVHGLDVLSEIGLNVAVIPHYDNQEGGNHDTRFCYLGERRLAMLEPELPDGAFVLGIDEHTGVVIDLDADTAEIVGKGAVTLRRDGESVRLEAGQTVPVDTLRAAGSDLGPSRTTGAAALGSDLGPAPDPSATGDQDAAAAATARDIDSLAAATAVHEAAFETALDARRRRRRRGGDPPARVRDRRVVPRHPAVRRRRPCSGHAAVDDRPSRCRRERGGARRPRGARSGGRGSARRPCRRPLGEGIRRLRLDP